MLSAAVSGTSLARCRTVPPGTFRNTDWCLLFPCRVVFAASTQCGNQRPSCLRLHQMWHLWRLGEHLPYLQGHSSTFRSFANLRALSWARLSFTSLPQMFNFRCCFQNLFLLLLGHWPETSLLTAAASHFQPPCHCSLLGKPESRKETDLCGGQLRVWEPKSGSSLLVETEGRQAMPTKTSPIISRVWALEPWILVL